MTADTLARIAAAIDADERTEQSNWPLSRERARGYIAVARAALGMELTLTAHLAGYIPDAAPHDDIDRAGIELRAALAALALETEVPATATGAGAAAGKAT